MAFLCEITQLYWTWPLPLRENAKESTKERRWQRIRVQLTHTGNEDGPIDAPEEAHHIGVDAIRLVHIKHIQQGGTLAQYLTARSVVRNERTSGTSLRSFP